MDGKIDIMPDCIMKSVVKICDERIARLQIAIPLCKHSKRKHKAKKMLKLFNDFRSGYLHELSITEKG